MYCTLRLVVCLNTCVAAFVTRSHTHLQEVLPGSPASLAGLETGTDYILGAEDALFECKEWPCTVLLRPVSTVYLVVSCA